MVMTPYLRLAGETGVTAFHIRAEAIEVRFVDGYIYTYSYAVPGRVHVEAMKLLAREGRGLSTYISRNVREKYAARRQAGRVTRKQQPPP